MECYPDRCVLNHVYISFAGVGYVLMPPLSTQVDVRLTSKGKDGGAD